MKRIFSLMMALCLMFCTVLPAFAAEAGAKETIAAVMDSGTPAPGESAGETPEESATPSDGALYSDFTGGGTEFFTKIRLTVTDRAGNPIPGAVYGLYSAADDSLIETLTTDETGVALSGDVPMETDYYVQEISTPEGFLPNEGKHEINLTEVCAPSRIDVGVEYDPIMGRIKVIKTNEDGEPIPGVVFEVHKDSNWEWLCNITTDADGNATTPDLPYGYYQLYESSAPEDYATGGTYGVGISSHDETVEYPITNYRSKGDVKITKTGNDGKKIVGAVFEIYKADTDELVQEVTTGSGGTVWSSYMRLGNYYVVEKSVPAPYKLDATRHEFTLSYNYQSIYLNIENVVDGDPGKIKVIKTDDSGNPLDGVAFDLYRAWDSKKLSALTTAADGTAVSSELIPGDYYLMETTGKPGYTMESGQIPFTIDGTGAVVEKTVVNPKIRIFGNVRVVKQDDAGTPVAGVKFGVYCTQDKLLEELVTGADGTAVSGALNAGDYYLLEQETPVGFLPSTEKHPFTISENGVTVPVTVTNDRISGKVKVIKTGTDGEALSSVKFGIYEADTDRLVSQITTGWDGVAESDTLYYGGYYLKELETAGGYELIDTPIPFSITEQDVVLEIPVTNPLIMGGVTVLKLSGEPEQEPQDMSLFAWGEVDEAHKLLPGAVFGIYNARGQKLTEMVSGEDGKAEYFGLPQGHYYLKELSAPEGFLLLDELIPFEISEQGDICEQVVYNPEGFGTLAVQKSGEDGALSGVAFDVYRTATDEKMGSIVTDADGLASLTLPLGRYYLVETATAPGYALLAGRVSFTLTADGETLELPILNQKEQIGCDKGQVKVLKRDADSDVFLPGASFAICRVSDESKVSEVVTGTDGTAMSQSIPAGDYYLLELRAPDGFAISEEKHPITVTAGETVEITITNKKLPETPSEPEPDAKTGTVKIVKVDAADSNKKLAGASFAVYETVGGKKVGELLTGKDGTATLTLPEGDYTLRETQAPEGFQLSGESISLHLKAGETRELTVKNSKSDPSTPPEQSAKPSILRIVKQDADSGKKLADAVFGVFRAGDDKQIDTLTTNKNGVVELKLAAGDYYIREQAAPEGYRLKKTDINFHLEADATRELVVKNTKEDDPEKTGTLRLTKEDKETGDVLKNAVFGVYDSDDELVEEITTDRRGVAEVELPVGSFYLKELEAPKGYRIDRKEVNFKITDDKTTKVTVKNEKKDSNTVTPNEPTGTIQLVKSAAGTGKRLSGAVFGIYEGTGDKKMAELTTDANGTATLDLPVGSYSLKELRAPAGFQAESTRILFEIRKGGKTVVEVTNVPEGAAVPETPVIPSTPTAPVTPPSTSDTPQITIPKTGEAFPILPYALAALCLGAAALCGAAVYKQRKTETD